MIMSFNSCKTTHDNKSERSHALKLNGRFQVIKKKKQDKIQTHLYFSN